MYARIQNFMHKNIGLPENLKVKEEQYDTLS